MTMMNQTPQSIGGGTGLALDKLPMPRPQDQRFTLAEAYKIFISLAMDHFDPDDEDDVDLYKQFHDTLLDLYNGSPFASRVFR